jgi:DNA-binding Lrp family transcriptional regulator
VKDTLLDQKDHDILHALKINSRKTVAELSQELGIPRATVHERIVKLRKKGVIRRFTIEQDYQSLGLPTLAYVSVSYAPGKLDQLKKGLSGIDGVLGIYVLSGEWGILLKMRGRSIEDIGRTVIKEIQLLPGVSKARTLACFEVIKDEQ